MTFRHFWSSHLQTLELNVGSYPIYRTSPATPADNAAAGVVHHSIKVGQARAIETYASQIARLSEGTDLGSHLADAGVLVPVPKSSIHRAEDQWVPLMIAEALHAEGIGSGVEVLLERHSPVPKSGGVRSLGSRPTVEQHFESMRVTTGMYGPERVTLVDDVITIGRTTFGAALRILDAYPDTEVQVFSLVRALRYTSINTLPEMRRPMVSRYWRDESHAEYFIKHGPPY